MGKRNFKIQAIEADIEAWNAFVDVSDEAWIWHRCEFINAMATWVGRSNISFSVLDEKAGGDMVAVVSLHLVEGRVSGIFPWKVLDSVGGVACVNGLGRKEKLCIIEFVYGHLMKLAAKYNAVRPSLVFKLTSAPLSKRSSTISFDCRYVIGVIS